MTDLRPAWRSHVGRDYERECSRDRKFVVPALAGQLPSGQLLLYDRFKARLEIPCGRDYERECSRDRKFVVPALAGQLPSGQPLISDRFKARLKPVLQTGFHEIPTLYLSIRYKCARMACPDATSVL